MSRKEGTCKGVEAGCPPCMSQCDMCSAIDDRREHNARKREERIAESKRLGIDCDEDGYPTLQARADFFGMESLTEDEQLELMGEV